MNRQTDIDRLLRGWLDEGELTPPDGPVWAALERVETTRQRGALRVSLEERVMRMQPLATVAAVAVMAIIGLAIYFNLAGGPNVGDPDASSTPVPGSTRTEDFAHPIAVVPPEGWTLLENQTSVVISRLEGNAVAEQIGVVDTSATLIWAGLDDGHVAWPDDLAAWLEDFPVRSDEEGPGSVDIVLDGTSQATVAGEPATVIDATTAFTAEAGLEASINLIVSDVEPFGPDVLVLDGAGRIRFMVLEDRNLAIVYHARADEFSEARLDAVIDSLRFTGD
jgi:hypothetical protein